MKKALTDRSEVQRRSEEALDVLSNLGFKLCVFDLERLPLRHV